MPSPTFYGISLMGLYGVVLIEVFLLHRWRGQPMNWREVAVNMNSGQALLWLLQGLRIAAYGFVAEHLSLRLVTDLPPVALFPVAFLLWDLAFYCSHRAHHAIPLLWEIHAVHHQGEAFNISLAVRNAWLQVLTPTPFFVVLAVLGVPLEVFLSVGALHYTVQLYNHNGLTLRPSPLDRVMVTPRHHRVHHATDPAYHDRNFGSALVIWDRLFGTFAEERSEHPIRIGLPAAPRTENPLWLNLEPLTRRLGLGDADAFLPARPVRVGTGWVVAGSLLQFFLLCLYIMGLPRWPLGQSAALMGFIVGGTLLLGGAADGARRAIVAWALLAVVGVGGGLTQAVDLGPWGQALLIAALVHGLWGLASLRGQPAPFRGPASP